MDNTTRTLRQVAILLMLATGHVAAPVRTVYTETAPTAQEAAR